MFAAMSKITKALVGEDNELPVGMTFNNSILMREFAKIFKLTAIYGNDQQEAYVLPRQCRLNELHQTPLRCILANSIQESDQFGMAHEFNFHPIVCIFNEAPVHAIRLSADIKPLIKNAARCASAYASIFTSKKLEEIYNFEGNKKILSLPIRPFWNGPRNPTNKAITYATIPMQPGKYDTNKLFQFQNRFGGVIMNTVSTSPGQLQDSIRSHFLTAKYILNLSYCNPDIYIFILAAACGCPVISVQNPFIEEYFGTSAAFIDNISELNLFDTVKLNSIGKSQKLLASMSASEYNDIVSVWDSLFTECSRSMVC